MERRGDLAMERDGANDRKLEYRQILKYREIIIRGILKLVNCSKRILTRRWSEKKMKRA
jgi:hypothetical protein